MAKKGGEEMLSQFYKCPTCEGAVEVQATFETSPDLGDTIELEVHCATCSDRRYASLDEFDFGSKLKEIISKLGT